MVDENVLSYRTLAVLSRLGNYLKELVLTVESDRDNNDHVNLSFSAEFRETDEIGGNFGSVWFDPNKPLSLYSIHKNPNEFGLVTSGKVGPIKSWEGFEQAKQLLGQDRVAEELFYLTIASGFDLFETDFRREGFISDLINEGLSFWLHLSFEEDDIKVERDYDACVGINYRDQDKLSLSNFLNDG